MIDVVGCLKSTLATSISSSGHVDYEEVALLNVQHVVQLCTGLTVHCSFHYDVRVASGIPSRTKEERVREFQVFLHPTLLRGTHDIQNLNI